MTPKTFLHISYELSRVENIMNHISRIVCTFKIVCSAKFVPLLSTIDSVVDTDSNFNKPLAAWLLHRTRTLKIAWGIEITVGFNLLR